ncbi:MAG: hypothetical protein OXH41_06605 [Chloroflexi bacterium]|nr:hypothetical protein [Chloroflexota bacterium]
MSSLVERALQWLDEALLLIGKVLATAVLFPFTWWLPGPELLIARIWGRDLEGDQ